MSNVSLVGQVSDDQFNSRAEQAALAAEEAQAAAEAAQAAAEAALAATLAALDAQTLDDHADVSVPSPSIDQILAWSGSQWIAKDAAAITVQFGDLTDVTITTPSVGEVVAWNGSEWVNQAVPPSPLSLPLAGGTMTGDIVLFASTPPTGLSAASKAYVDQEVANAGSSAPYDFAIFFDGSPADGEDIYRTVAVRDWYLPSGFAGSVCECRIAPTAPVVFDIERNAVKIGEIRFAGGATTATFQLVADEQFVSGDNLAIVAPTPADISITDLQFTIAAIIGTP